MCWNAPYFLIKLRISLVNRRETLHASLYSYELEFVPSGVSVTIFYAEDDLQGDHISDGHHGQKCMIAKSTQDHSGFARASPGTLHSDLRHSVMHLADFHNMLEIMISHQLIVVFHIKCVH